MASMGCHVGPVILARIILGLAISVFVIHSIMAG